MVCDCWLSLQFEKGGGIKGVLTHPSSKPYIVDVCKRLVVPADIDLCYGLVAYHDALACCFARLLLWTLPRPHGVGSGKTAERNMGKVL